MRKCMPHIQMEMVEIFLFYLTGDKGHNTFLPQEWFICSP